MSQQKQNSKKTVTNEEHWKERMNFYQREIKKNEKIFLKIAEECKNKKRNLIEQIFTLMPMSLNKNEKMIYILDKKVNSDEIHHYENIDATESGIVLGYIINIARAMAHCLLIDLPYRMQMKGSKSTIKKDQKEYILNKEVNFSEFKEGIKLLAENINFLCHSQGLHIPKNRRMYIADNLLLLKDWKDLGVESYLRKDENNLEEEIKIEEKEN